MSAIVNNGPQFNAAPDVAEEEIDLAELLGVVFEGRWLIVAITAVALLIGAYQAFTAVRIYQASGLLQVEERYSGLANFETTMMYESFSAVNTEIEILRSRSVLGDVVDNLKLDIYAEPEFATEIGAALARSAPPGERPMITVDTFDVPDSARGTALKLIAAGPDTFELYDAEDGFVARGVVGDERRHRREIEH